MREGEREGEIVRARERLSKSKREGGENEKSREGEREGESKKGR